MKRSITHIFNLYVSLLLIFSFAVPFFHPGFAQAGTEAGIPALAPTVFNVWYGGTQSFGQVGNPQQWVNILGNVSDADGIYALEYSLNGGPAVPLTRGPDGVRLERAGDFNADIDYTDLNSGLNTVVITATDTFSNTAAQTVNVNYTSGQTWPLPYTIDWSTVGNIQDVAQVVDGKWGVSAAGLRTLEPGHNRLVAIGDLNWTEYEVTVPFTIHDADWDAAGAGGHGFPGIWLVLRWSGHTDAVPPAQPTPNWGPYGAAAYWALPQEGVDAAYLALTGTESSKSFPSAPLDGDYILKARVETMPGQVGGLYSAKVWQEGDPEPLDWDVTYQKGPSDVGTGSLLLGARYTDVTFGDVSVVPLSDLDYTLTVHTAGAGSVTWDPNLSQYDHGAEVELTAQAGSGSFFSGWSGSTTGIVNPKTLYMNGNKVVTATFTAGNPTPIVSDDFNTCSLNEQWTSTMPLSATLSLTGTHAQISLPAGINHTFSGTNPDNFVNNTARIMQPVSNTGFEFEVEFDSAIAQAGQTQGILIEQDEDDLLAVGFSGEGATYISAAGVVKGSLSSIEGVSPKNIGAQGAKPLKLHVSRVGDEWTISYSVNNGALTPYASFSHAMAVSAVGPYAGNNSQQGSAPAHTAKIDYFYNNVDLPAAGDGDGNRVTVSIIGTGSVEKDPAGPSYSCGQEVELTALGGTGWAFESWSGAVVGSSNPATLTVSGDHSVTATFTLSNYALSVIKSGSGSGTVSSVPAGIDCGATCSANYVYGTSVTLTAVAASGSTFTGWSGAGCSGTGTCVVSMDAAKSVTATFVKGYQLSVTKSGSGSGTVSSVPAGINCGATCSANYADGTSVTLSAVADSGSTFSGWSGAGCSGTGTCVVSMDAAKSVTANFTMEEYKRWIYLPFITK